MDSFFEIELKKNKIDYQKVKDDSIFVIYDADKRYDLNFIIPVRGRLNFSAPMYDSFSNAKKNSNLKIAYTIVEYSDIPDHSKFCKKNKINYIWIKSEPGELFNKCLALNFGAMFSIKSEYFLFHDIDCLIQSDFFNKLMCNISRKNNCKAIQCFQGRRVLYLDQDNTEKIISKLITADDLKIGLPGISLPVNIGAPGGSILIGKDLFFEIGGYDPEFFKANAPEDIFFWEKVSVIDTMEISNNPEIEIFHMNHPPTYYDNPLINEMKLIYDNFKNSNLSDKKQLIKLKKELINNFFYE